MQAQFASRHTAKRECEVLSSAIKHLARAQRPAAPTAKANEAAARAGELSASAHEVWATGRVGVGMTIWARIGVRARVRVRLGAKVRIGVRMRVWEG